MSTPTRSDDFPLRARKRAKTRVGLVQALLPRLAETSLEEVSVADLCREVGISQGTFFNYFPTKVHLLTHFIQLWSLQVARLAQEVDQAHDDPLAAIEALFVATAQEIAPYPRVMSEIIAHQARGVPAVGPVEPAERLLFLQDDPRSTELPDTGLSPILSRWLGQAISRGFLPVGTPVPELTLATASVFFGVPLLLIDRDPQLIEPMYIRQLRLIWAGARAEYG